MPVTDADSFVALAGAKVFSMPTFEKKKNPKRQAAGSTNAVARWGKEQVRFACIAFVLAVMTIVLVFGLVFLLVLVIIVFVIVFVCVVDVVVVV